MDIFTYIRYRCRFSNFKSKTNIKRKKTVSRKLNFTRQ